MDENKSVTKADFDEAVKQPWNTSTCVVAQFCKRIGIPLYIHQNGDNNPLLKKEVIDNIMSQFDGKFCKPGDEKTYPSVIALRASLPIQVID